MSGLAVRRSRALVQEPQDPSDGALRLVEQEEMPAALDHVEASVGQPGRQHPGVQHRHAWIVVPRDDERRLLTRCSHGRLDHPHAA